MYTVKEIDEKLYNEFNKNITTYNLFQTLGMTNSRKFNYGRVKFLGFYEKEVLKGTTQLLIEKIPYIGKKMGTSIKGMNIEFTEEQLKSCAEGLKKYLKENGFLLFRMDLPVAYKTFDREFHIQKIDDFDFPVDGKIQEKLINAGFKEFFIDDNYTGRSPQWSMLVDTSSETVINKQMNRSVKRGIKDAIKYGVELKKIDDVFQKDEIEQERFIDIFYKLHKKNADINQIDVMAPKYYENLFKNSPNLQLFLVKLNTNLFLKTTTENLEQKDNAKNQKMFDLANKLQKEEKEYIYIVGHISGFFNKLGYDLFTGLDYDYRDLGAKEFLMQEIFLFSNKKDIKYYDFWGILGNPIKSDPMYPIYTFKKKFSNIIVQYPGFWDIYTNRFMYLVFNRYLKYRYKKNH